MEMFVETVVKVREVRRVKGKAECIHSHTVCMRRKAWDQWMVKWIPARRNGRNVDENRSNLNWLL